jgi:hypothetical protein
MTATIHVEACLNHHSGNVGWAAIVIGAVAPPTMLLGAMTGFPEGAVMSELHAVQRALDRALIKGLILPGEEVVIAMRAANSLAVLQHLFPGAQWTGRDVARAKRVHRKVLNALAPLTANVEAYRIKIALSYVGPGDWSNQAASTARRIMERGYV